MIQYFSITTFRNRIASLLKIKRGVYAGVTSEIVKEFNGKTIEQIRQNRDMILCENDVIIIKLRLPDKRQRLSRKDGYRLIYIVSKTQETVIFLDIYPKNGPSQQLSISENRLTALLEVFTAEAKAAALAPFDLY